MVVTVVVVVVVAVAVVLVSAGLCCGSGKLLCEAKKELDQLSHCYHSLLK